MIFVFKLKLRLSIEKNSPLQNYTSFLKVQAK